MRRILVAQTGALVSLLDGSENEVRTAWEEHFGR